MKQSSNLPIFQSYRFRILILVLFLNAYICTRAQWTTTSNNSIYTGYKLEIPVANNPSAWINTYSNNCIPSLNNPDNPIQVMVAQHTNHFRMSQLGVISGYSMNPNPNGIGFIEMPLYDCTKQTDYNFKTDLDGAKLILDGNDNNGNYNKYTSWWSNNITNHQNTTIEGTLTTTGNMTCGGTLNAQDVVTTNLTSSSSSLGATNASSLAVSGAITGGSLTISGNISATDMTVANLTANNSIYTNNLTVNNAPTFNNGLNIKNSALKILDNNNNVVWNFRADGKLGIGVADAQMTGPYWLWVKNGIMTERVKVAVKGTADWSDKVFDKSYSLKSLSEVESYITKNRHLPDIPSAEEVVKDGIDIQQMDAKLLQKIEELTLYVIDLKKEVEILKRKK